MTHTTRNSILLFFGFFGLVILFIYIYTTHHAKTVALKSPPLVQEQTPAASDVDLKVYEEQVKNALITVPDTNIKISLVGGRASYGTSSDGGDVTLLKVFGGEKVPTGKTHIFADIAVQSGGTGVFHYVGLFNIVDGKAVYTSAYFIGDRVTLVSASTAPKDSKSYILTVTYLDRNEGEALAEDPSVSKEAKIEVFNNEFVAESQ